MKKYLKANKIILEKKIAYGKFIEIENGIISGIFDRIPNDAEYIDYSNYTIAPGFVDTHIHGCKGHDIMDATEEGLLEISKAVAKVGVTTFLPTTLTASVEDTNKAIENISQNYKKVSGAKIGGIFLEGPFFCEKYKGAQNPAYFLDPDFEILKSWKEIAGDLPIKIALAPERKGSMDFIKKAKESNFTIALAHSDATYEQAKEAVDNGASIFVHMFNAMSPLHHRNPGMVGAGLSIKDVFAELICDGHHVHPAAAQVVVNAKSKDYVALITDCMSATLMPDGEYKLGEFDVKVENGTARMNDGNLAGSILLLKDAVKNVVKWGIANEFDAIQMASLTPAKSVGIDDKCGIIAAGRCADLNILDENLELVATYINGEIVE